AGGVTSSQPPSESASAVPPPGLPVPQDAGGVTLSQPPSESASAVPPPGLPMPQEASGTSSSLPPSAPTPATLQSGAEHIDPAQPIAIVGLAGRYPGASSIDAFWQNLAAGRDGIGEVPVQRWDHSRFYDPRAGVAGKTNSKWGGFLDDVDGFDPLFFNIAPSEAAYMDPQERLFLQCAWETLEDAGYTRAALASGAAGLGGGNVGVFVGVMYEEYQLYGAESTGAGRPAALGGSAASIANRVSYFCNFHGPSLAVDSMCSSSLSAIHLACDSLRSGSCDAALAGGVNLTLHPNKYLLLSQGRFMSSTGRCASFGEGGDGYVPGEGVGAVLLKTLDRAVADGDQIYGVIRASALNHGGKTHGYTVPNPHAQTAVIARALARAGVDAGDIGYIEAHGTGTSLGDPIEIAALGRVFDPAGVARGACAIGSVKSNIGHAESAAGIAGLTKVLLQIRHGQLAPSLHSSTLNPAIDFAASPFRVQRRLEAWPRRRVETADGVREQPRLAGLSSFGAGGANAHMIIEEFIPAARPEGATWRIDADAPAIFPFSARSRERLSEVVERFVALLDSCDDADLPALAHGLQAGREAFELRLAVVAGTLAELRAKLRAVLAAGGEAIVAYGRQQRVGEADVDRLIANGDLDALAEHWARHGALDWSRLRGAAAAPRKRSLPTYPFARERYWFGRDGGPGAGPGAGPGREPERRAAEPSAPDVVPQDAAARAVAADQASAPAGLPLPLLFAPSWHATETHEPQAQADVFAADHLADRNVVVLCEIDGAASLSVALAPAECIVMASPEPQAHVRYAAYAARLLELVQELARARSKRVLLQVVVPADGAGALFAGLGGLLRCAQFEHPSLRCQLIEIAGEPTDLAARLRAERFRGDAAVQVRFEQGRRWERQWHELDTAPASPAASSDAALPWKAAGVYLITGGAGGLGLLLAEEIAA
ncbi:beta-ketoacyl synthase N-terminal-like domain-containing protein, partial [Burkholderia sp. 3C]